MKKLTNILVILTLCLVTNFAYADQFTVPFECNPRKIQREFAKAGIKLDMMYEEKSKESWGYIFNAGSNYSIYSYRPATEEEMYLLMEIINVKIHS